MYCSYIHIYICTYSILYVSINFPTFTKHSNLSKTKTNITSSWWNNHQTVTPIFPPLLQKSSTFIRYALFQFSLSIAFPLPLQKPLLLQWHVSFPLLASIIVRFMSWKYSKLSYESWLVLGSGYFVDQLWLLSFQCWDHFGFKMAKMLHLERIFEVTIRTGRFSPLSESNSCSITSNWIELHSCCFWNETSNTWNISYGLVFGVFEIEIPFQLENLLFFLAQFKETGTAPSVGSRNGPRNRFKSWLWFWIAALFSTGWMCRSTWCLDPAWLCWR